MRWGIASLYGMAAFSIGAAAMAAPRNADGLPSVVFSVANDYAAGTLDNGPLFDKAKAALLLAYSGNDNRFSEQLAPTAELTLRQGAAVVPLSAEIVRAAFSSCRGPLPYDEGNDWVQFSLICRTDEAAPITKYISFRDGAELNVSIWFDGDKIKRIVAMETIPIPGQRIFGKSVVDPSWTRN